MRDPRAWAGYLTEVIDLFARDAEVAFASHHWPTWGTDRVVELLTLQRDLYAYLHDQTVRLMNRGLVGAEIAEVLEMPPALEAAWHTHGYYGSVSHNVKAVYQRYLGWYDGNPAHLWPHPPVAAAERYVAFMGGADAVVEKARASYDAGDWRWVAEVLTHVVFAEPGHAAARSLLADTFERLAFGSENGTWRNVYLSGATELRDGSFGTPASTDAPDVVASLTPEMLFGALAVRVDGPRAWDERLSVDLALTDAGVTYRLTLANGVLTHTSAPQPGDADLRLSGGRAALGALAAAAGGGGLDPAGLAAAGIEVDGDLGVLGRLLAVLDPGDPDFAIVTPD